MNHGRREVVIWNVVASALSNPEQEAHHTRHASDEVEGVVLPITRGVQHAQGVNANAQPIHGVAILRQGGKHSGDAVRNMASGGEVCLEALRLFGGWQLFVEEKIDDVFRWVVSEFCDGVAAIMDAFGGRDERGATGANWDASKTRVEV